MDFHIKGGGVNCSREDSLGQFVSLLFSDHFVLQVNNNLLFLNAWKSEKSKKECAARKCRSWVCLQMTQLQCLIGYHADHAILCISSRFIFRDNKTFLVFSGPREQFRIHE